jgi:hypothetical protein
MSQQIINVGTAPDDGAGDPLRTAFIKTNLNFTELYATAGITGIANGSSNISIPMANGNINLSAGGTANILIIRSAGANVTGTLGVQGLTKLTTLSTTGSIQNAGECEIAEVKRCIQYMEDNVQDDDYSETFEGFKPYEILKIKRDLAIMQEVLPQQTVELNKINFYMFITEHDKRRQTKFIDTFPELKMYWKECVKAYINHH